MVYPHDFSDSKSLQDLWVPGNISIFLFDIRMKYFFTILNHYQDTSLKVKECLCPFEFSPFP